MHITTTTQHVILAICEDLLQYMLDKLGKIKKNDGMNKIEKSKVIRVSSRRKNF